MNELPNIVSFSGGQTSGYMLRRLMDSESNFHQRFTVIFCNTGKEHDKTLDFVHDVETKWGVPITWLEYTRVPARDIDPAWIPPGRRRINLAKKVEDGESDHWFKIVDYASAARDKDERGPFDELLEWSPVLPNVRTRQCSVQLKVRTRDRFMFAQGWTVANTYIGIRADEAHRKLEILANVERHERPHFPLIDMGVTRARVDAFWNAHPFKLNISNEDGNCRLCYLKARWKRVAIAKADPDTLKWWLNKEVEFKTKADGDGAFFRKGQPYADIAWEASQPPQPAFAFMDEDVPCSCAVGGYRHAQAESDDE